MPQLRYAYRAISGTIVRTSRQYTGSKQAAIAERIAAFCTADGRMTSRTPLVSIDGRDVSLDTNLIPTVQPRPKKQPTVTVQGRRLTAHQKRVYDIVTALMGQPGYIGYICNSQARRFSWYLTADSAESLADLVRATVAAIHDILAENEIAIEGVICHQGTSGRIAPGVRYENGKAVGVVYGGHVQFVIPG